MARYWNAHQRDTIGFGRYLIRPWAWRHANRLEDENIGWPHKERTLLPRELALAGSRLAVMLATAWLALGALVGRGPWY